MRADGALAMDAEPEGPQEIPADREHQEPEVQARGLKGPREPSAEEIARHWLTTSQLSRGARCA